MSSRTPKVIVDIAPDRRTINFDTNLFYDDPNRLFFWFVSLIYPNLGGIKFQETTATRQSTSGKMEENSFPLVSSCCVQFVLLAG